MSGACALVIVCAPWKKRKGDDVAIVRERLAIAMVKDVRHAR